jgi:hypothetical protein
MKGPVLKTATVIQAALMAAVVSAWLPPVIRAVRLLDGASAFGTNMAGGDPWDDYVFGAQLLISYGFGLLVGVGLVWLLWRTCNWLLSLPVTASAVIGLYVSLTQPESLIALLPPMQPFRPAVFSAVIGLAALLMTRLYPQPAPEPKRAVS